MKLPVAEFTMGGDMASAQLWYLLSGSFAPYWYVPQMNVMMVGTLSIDAWVVTFGPARRGLGGAMAL